MGLDLNSPIIVSACTLSEQTDNIVRMEDNGAGAVVLFSLFEEQIRHEEAKFKAKYSCEWLHKRNRTCKGHYYTVCYGIGEKANWLR